MMAMAMSTDAVPLGSPVINARLVMLFNLRCDRRLSSAVGRFSDRRPQYGECGTQRDEL